MSFSPTARRRPFPSTHPQRNGFSPTRTRRELSPGPHDYNRPTNGLNINDRSRTPSPNPQNLSRPRRQTAPDTKPLLPAENNITPPLAAPETEDESDDRETVSGSNPGVDDGFFSTESNNNPVGGGDIDNPEVENIPEVPKTEPEERVYPPIYPENPDFPDLDETDRGRYPSNHPRYPPNYPDFPYAPGFGPEVYNIPDYGTGTEISGESIPDVNVYQHKKTLAQGMMDLALFSANANQLRYVLESFDRHPYFYPSIVMISFSLLLQVAVGVGLIWNSRYNVKDKKEICIANKVNNFTVIGIFLITVVNVFVSAFGVANSQPAQTPIQSTST